MYRPALFALVPSLLLASFLLRQQRIDAEVAIRQQHTLSALARFDDQLVEYTTASERQIQWLLEDDSKASFRPILGLVDQLGDLSSRAEGIIHTLRKVTLPDSVVTRLTADLRELILLGREREASFYHNFGEQLNLREEDAARIVEVRSKDWNTADQTLRKLTESSRQNDNQLLRLLSIEITAARSAAVHHLTYLFGRRISCFPVLMAAYPESLPRSNSDSFGVYFFTALPTIDDRYDHVDFTIDGERYPLDGFGVVHYQGTYRPHQALQIEYMVTNPLTGEAHRRRQEYNPPIHTGATR